MAALGGGIASGRFNAGWVFQTAIGVLQRRGLTVVLLAFALNFGPAWILRGLHLPTVTRAVATPAAWTVSLAEALLFLGIAMLSRATISAIALGEMTGRPTTTTHALIAGIRAAPILLPFSLVSDLGGLAAPFVIRSGNYTAHAYIQLMATIGGAAVFIMVGVAAAVTVSERTGVMATASRANHLMAGARWTLMLWVVGFLVLEDVLRNLSSYLIRSMGCAVCRLVPSLPIYPTDFVALPGVVMSAAWSVLLVAVYLDLGRIRDGLTPGALAAVFE